MYWVGPFLLGFLNKTLLSRLILLSICKCLCHMACLLCKFLRNYLRLQKFPFQNHAVFHWRKNLCTFFLICYSGCSWSQALQFLQVCHSSSLLCNFRLLCWSKGHFHAAILWAIRLCRARHCTIGFLPIRIFCSCGRCLCRCRLWWSLRLSWSSCSSIDLRNNALWEIRYRFRFVSCPPFLRHRPHSFRIILNKNCSLVSS